MITSSAFLKNSAVLIFLNIKILCSLVSKEKLHDPTYKTLCLECSLRELVSAGPDGLALPEQAASHGSQEAWAGSAQVSSPFLASGP